MHMPVNIKTMYWVFLGHSGIFSNQPLNHMAVFESEVYWLKSPVGAALSGMFAQGHYQKVESQPLGKKNDEHGDETKEYKIF